MTKDHASAELPSKRDRQPTKADDQTELDSGRYEGKIVQALFKRWRALAFLLIVLIVGCYAFHYKALSDPGSESKQLADHAPQEIDFLVSDLRVSIDVDAYLAPASQQ